MFICQTWGWQRLNSTMTHVQTAPETFEGAAGKPSDVWGSMLNCVVDEEHGEVCHYNELVAKIVAKKST